HIEIAISIGQGRPKRILQPPFAQWNSRARAANHVRRLAHVLRSTGENEARFSQQKKLGAAHDGLETGPADRIHGQSWDGRRHTNLKANMSAKIDRIRAGLLRVAKDNVVDLLRTDA